MKHIDSYSSSFACREFVIIKNNESVLVLMHGLKCGVKWRIDLPMVAQEFCGLLSQAVTHHQGQRFNRKHS